MATDSVYTIGTSGRDYSSYGAAVADIGTGIPSDLVTADIRLVLRGNNDSGSEILESAITFPSMTTDATRYVQIEPASGNGALGDPNDHTTRATGVALGYDPSAGVALSLSASYAALFGTTSEIKLVIERMQLRATGSRGRPITINHFATGSAIRDCILQTESATGQTSILRGTTGGATLTLENCLIVFNASDRDAIQADYTATTVKNCTFVQTNGSATTGAPFVQSAGASNPALYNCVCFGFVDAPSSNTSLTLVNNATDLSAATFGGTGTVGSLTPGSELTNVTLASFDARVQAGSSLIDAASAANATATDILGQTRDASPTIGAYEVLSAGGGTDNLTTGDLTGAAPAFSTGAFGQAHALSTGDLTSAAPTLTAGTLGQTHTLSTGDLTSAAPTLTAGALGQVHALAPGDLASSAPTLTAGTLGQTHTLSTGDLDGSAPTLGSNALGQTHALQTGDLTGAAPVLDAGTLGTSGVDALTTGDLTGAAPLLNALSLGQIHVLVTSNLTGAAPLLDGGTLGQVHGFAAADIVASAPVLAGGTIGVVHVLSTGDLLLSAPTLDGGTIGQAHVFAASDLLAASPILASGAISQIHVLSAGDLVSSAPVLDGGTIGPSDVLDTTTPGGRIALEVQEALAEVGTALSGQEAADIAAEVKAALAEVAGELGE